MFFQAVLEKKKKGKKKNPKFLVSRGYVQRMGTFCNLHFNWNAQDRSDYARQGLPLHFSFFFLFFFFFKSDLSKCIYLCIPFYMCWARGDSGHSFMVPSDTLWKLYPLSSRFPILPPPLLVWIHSSSCVFGLGKQSCCLWVISRAQISGSFFLGS